MASPIPISTAKDEFEERRFMYSSIEELLVPGFLAHVVSVAGVTLSMRSLSSGDYTLLRHRVPPGATTRTFKEWVVATSVWVVDGQVVLGDVNAPAKIRPFLRNLPNTALDALFSIYTSLFNEYGRAMERLEAFCYEDHSRLLWRMMGRQHPMHDNVSGIPGSSSLGLNNVQKLWQAYNIAEDDKLSWQQDWAAAKLVASATAPKGVKKLSQRDESEHRLESERRQRVIARIYYEVTGRMLGENKGGMVVFRSVTPEELVDEMNRMMRGERDWHDEVIESYKSRIREKHETDRQRHETRMAEIAELESEIGSTSTSDLKGYTLEQLRSMRKNLTRTSSEVATTSAPTRLYDKFVRENIRIGGVTEGGAVEKPLTVDGEESKSTVMDQIRERQVRLNHRGEG